ncbi:pyridoxamine 5'-phosphate oxidase [Neolewinella xylanilytica]|uniref:Pyridoxamine 5'-phosphate oxidase n=1 Tax=Neolewinella xylanilytica TaxID=1514080 RepID=A0A2S6I1Z8_9BACT|nr:pyridoxamine 5'-phosphate oxidase family protein [Neolewinella xylanilytica]PPK85109.1 pyridoxamine 5'-phosphate oxidase [Neolewinella xylanilytica]
MGKQLSSLTPDLTSFIHRQPMFFVATAPLDGRVNVSPKGMDSLRVLAPNRIIWLNVTGSGNETAGHVLENGRMTLMWCAFRAAPLILRTYGTARVIYPGDIAWDDYAGQLPERVGARQIFEQQIDTVQTSCGMAVPLMDFVDDRDALDKWAERQGPVGLTNYRHEKNRVTLDGLPTGIE